MFTDKLKIVRGSAGSFNLYFIYEKTRRPFPLNSATEIKVALPGQLAVQTLTLTGNDLALVGVADLGQVLVSYDSTVSNALKLCDGPNGLSFTAEVVFPDGSQYFNFDNILFVSDPKVVPA